MLKLHPTLESESGAAPPITPQSSLGKMAQGTVSISIGELRVGATCSHPVEGDEGVLLLGANTRITQQLINGLRDRGIASIDVDPRDLAAMRGAGAKKKTAVKRSTESQEWSPTKVVKDILVDRHDEDLSQDRSERLKHSMGIARERFDELKLKLASEKIRSVNELREISDLYAQSMVDDLDQTVGAISVATKLNDPDERSVRMAVIGMAVAVELGLNGQQTLEVGMVGLLHDVGLYVMDPKYSKPVELMSDAERWEYQKHPLISTACICDVMDIPHSVQLAVQQVHEQFDGTGYPRGTRGQRIHTYARILNVVDSYLQLTTATPLRQPIVPHDAIGLMLHQASRGLFDPKVIRAFLNTETLFPLGSTVELNSGDLAQVIRRPRNGFAAPVLVSTEGNRIELESTSLEIVRPVCDPKIEQMRLTPEVMQSSEWHPGNYAVVI